VALLSDSENLTFYVIPVLKPIKLKGCYDTDFTVQLMLTSSLLHLCNYFHIYVINLLLAVISRLLMALFVAPGAVFMAILVCFCTFQFLFHCKNIRAAD